MIRPININLNAAHPELPLVEATTFTGAPSSVFIRGVPKAVGNWSITAVSVAVTYPDNTTTARAAVESAEGVWVATIPGTATSGRTLAGFRILADGIDENGAAVTGYVLGFADFSVFSFLPVPAPGETFYFLRYFDTMPTTPKKGDVAKIVGVLEFYNGTTWEAFDARAYALATQASNNANDLRRTLTANYYTSAQTDEAIERVAAYYITYNAAGAAFPTRADLINATTYYSGGVVRVPTRNDYAVVLADEAHDGAEYRYIYAVPDGATAGQWEAQYPIETNDYVALSNKPQINGHTLTGEGSQSGADLGLLDLAGGTMTGQLEVFNLLSAIRNVDTAGAVSGAKFVLRGATSEHYIQFAYQDYKYGLFAKNGSLDAGTFYPLDNIAAVPNKANASDLPYAISASIPLTVTSGAASTTLEDRTRNVRTVAAPGSGNTTTITATLPPIVAGKSRDMFLNLTVGSAASDAGDISLSIVEPSGATVQIDIGSVEDIGIGKNEILISENALPTTSGNVTTTHWLVTVRHEDFAS